MARQGSCSLGHEVRKFVEMTVQGCTHHVPCQSPDTRSPRRFGARFRLSVHAGWLPAVTGVVFLVSQIVANLATKSGKVFQSTVISHPTRTTFRPPGAEGREPARLYPCWAHVFVQ